MEKKLTIHFFVQFVHKQGTFFRFHNWALGLTELGHKVTVFGASYTRGEKNRVEFIDGIEYHISACYFPLQSIFGQITHPFSGLKRLFKRYPKCDVAHVFQPHISAYLPWYFNRRKAHVNVYDWDDLWTNGLAKKGKDFLSKWVYHQVKYIEGAAPAAAVLTTTCSHFLAKKIQEIKSSKTSIVYNGFWDYIPNEKPLGRAKMGLNPDALYMGFMGRTAHASEMINCIELLKIASLTFPNIRLALCGMPREVIEYADPIIIDKIDYLGYLKPVDTRDFAVSLDIGLLPLEDNEFNESRFPIKFAEYLAANIPILCSEVGECANIAKQFPFIKLSGNDDGEWVKSGLDILSKINSKQWPSVERDQIVSYLGWNNISLGLANVYHESVT